MNQDQWLDRCHFGDCRDLMRAMISDGVKVQTIVTSPPYFGLRDYGHPGQLGLEEAPDEYVSAMVDVFAHAREMLADDGTLWLNIGDSYAGSWGARGRGAQTNAARPDLESKHGTTSPARNGFPSIGIKRKDLIGIPWMLAFALRADGWFLRSDVIWAKPNGLPGSQQDRPTSSHECIFLLSKSARYFSDFDAIKTPPRESSMVRLAQDIQAQRGRHRANGGAKTNGAMKAVRGQCDKQRGHSRRHAGFNERWDAMSREEQQSAPAMMRDVWFVPPANYGGAHFAVMPEEIAARCILAGSRANDVVFDPFFGTGTTGMAAMKLGRRFVGCELNTDYEELQRERLCERGLTVEFD
ncbi:site-specific DNA-methyltransferase [Burkholderia cepacia]|uniref:DNA-methyltransferase n=1 Tax=Burkholderia cepacia TaxID=292 RepID=UPI001F2B3E34|nr:site-specific DNA-methyltransferase [Burkholderia cepacia]MCE4125791.1 site-specific DNA-methyltransferase [Burkholderia cepacia]